MMELMQLAILILNIGLVFLGLIYIALAIISIGLLLREGQQANKARAPLLKPYRPGRNSLQEFHFWYKNFGQTEAKNIKVTYKIKNLGEIKIPERGFRILPYKTTLGNTEEYAVNLNWTAEERIPDNYHGEITVRITYESDFSKPELIEVPIIINKGEIEFPTLL